MQIWQSIISIQDMKDLSIIGQCSECHKDNFFLDFKHIGNGIVKYHKIIRVLYDIYVNSHELQMKLLFTNFFFLLFQ